MDIYRVLYLRRLELGLSRKALCDVLHMKTSDMKRAEDGNPKAHTLEKVSEWAAALGLKIVVRCKDDS